MKKHILTIAILIIMTTCLFACKKRIDYSQFNNVEKPNTEKLSGDYYLDFIEMHNFVVTQLQSESTPFFYVLNGQFDISGDNKQKVIEVKCKCMDGTIENDVDLFFSMVLNYMAINAAEQDSRFNEPKTDEDGAYIDFGTVFNTYDLKLYADTQTGTVIKNAYVNHGKKIPVESRYIKES